MRIKGRICVPRTGDLTRLIMEEATWETEVEMRSKYPHLFEHPGDVDLQLVGLMHLRLDHGVQIC